MTSTIVPSSFYSNNNNNNNNTNSKSRRSTLQLSTIQEEVDTVVPDSTTTPQQQQQLLNKDMNDFHVGEDVLVKQKDGRYYLGTIVEVSCLIKECLVKFGDNTDRWAKFKTLTKLNTSEQDDLLLCVVCKKSSPKCQNDIIICDQCGRGYHQYCHHPKIAEEYQKEEAVWLCRRCLNVDPEKRNKSDWKLLKNRKSKSNHNKFNDATVSTKTLPYELTSLSWDTYHRVNNEHVYCYCGEGGEWYKQMLQCGRCRQWFHERCIDCLQYPLYCGDRFYVFVCSICNHGKEFLRRLEMKWVDLVHLMLFNLTAYNSRKYYDLDTTIIPYINDNWHALQLPPKISAVSKSERRENILSILTNNRNRFKCGREIKKRVTIWGLRVRLPPPAPTITLNFNGPITEEQLRERWQGNRRLQFLSNHNNFNNNDDADDDDDDGDDDGENNDEDDDEDDEIDENEDDDDDDDEDEDDYELYSNKNKKLIPFDKHMKNVMMGVAYQHSNNQSETDSPCPSPEVEQQQQQQQQQQDIYNNHNNDNLPPNTRGCAKKTATITERRKRLLTGRSLRKTKQRRNTNDGICGDTTIIDDTTRVYPTRLSLDNKNYQKNNQETTLPLTPPTSVSAPPTPPALSTTTSLLSDVSNDFGDSNSLDKQLNSNNNNNNNSNNHHNTPYDTSGDETSSKSTLDLIIPPPKDFEGKNNPFLTLLRSTNEQQKNKNKTNKKKDNNNIVTSLPLPLTAVIPGKPIMRPTKRQLSEKDIFIGPNGEVKRKRLRRNRNNNNNNNTYSTNNCGLITASKTATVLPVKPDAKEWAQLTTTSNNINNNNTSNNNNNSSSIDYSFNGRKLRQRPDKIQTDKEGNNSNNNGNNTKTNNNNNNNSNNNGTDMVDLKSSVNIYFGAANRIATGEKFTIKAKRIGPNGKLEFLIEWDGGSNGMT